MRRLLLIVCAALLLAPSLVVVVQAGDNASQWCEDNDDWGADHDTCVTCFNSGNAPVCYCKFFEYEGMLESYGFENFGQCVAYYTSVLR